MEAAKTENKHLKRFAQLKFARIVLVVGVSSGILSSSKIFEYSTDFNVYDSPSPFRVSVEYFSKNASSSVFYLSHYIFTDFFLLLVNILIDLFLVRKVKSDLKVKNRNQMEKMNEASTFEKNKLTEELKRNKSVKKKANALVICNIVVYVVCRLPELIGIFWEFLQPKMISATDFICQFNILCYLIYNTIEYVYMISYLFNIVIFYKFNNNFKKGLQNLWKRKFQ